MELRTFVALDSVGKIIPKANTYIYIQGTQTLAPVIEDADGKALSNPFLTSNQGLAQFKLPDGAYDILFEYKNTRGPRFSFQCIDTPLSANKLASSTGSMLVGRLPAVTDLRNVEPTAPGQTIQVASNLQGWATIADGGKGGGTFYHDANDSSSEDDGVMIIVTTGGKRWKRMYDGAVQAEWFGVRTDGVDCRLAVIAAIKYAFANGVRMVFPNSGSINIGKGFETQPGSGATGRIQFRASPSSKPCILDFNGSTIVPEDIPADESFDTAIWTLDPGTGTAAAGDVYSAKVDGQLISYTASAGDAKATIVAGLVANAKTFGQITSIYNVAVSSGGNFSITRKNGGTQAAPAITDPVKLTYNATNNDKWTSEVRMFHFYGGGSGFDDTGVWNPTSTNSPLPPVLITGLNYDYSKQSYRGGQRGEVGITSIQPFSDGTRLFDVEYAIGFRLKDCTFKNHYGNGIRIAKSYRPHIENVTMQDVSANQIKSPSGGQAADHTGGGIFINACYGGTVTKCSVRNSRKYLKEGEVFGGVSTKGTLCGYIGIWVEYGVDNETSYSSGAEGWNKHVPWVDWLMQNSDLTPELDRTTNGVTISDNAVSGYVLGIKSENDTDVLITGNQIRDCYNPIQITTGVGKVIGNHVSFGNTADINNPQTGYNSRRSLFCINNYLDTKAPKGTREEEVGILIHGNTLSLRRHSAFYLGQSGITVDSNKIVIDGNADVFHTANDLNTVGMRFINNTVVYTVKTTGASITPRGVDNAVFESNLFINKNTDVICKIEFGSSYSNASGVVVQDGRGDYLFKGNRMVGPWSVRWLNREARGISIANHWAAWERTSSNTTLAAGDSTLPPLYVRSAGTNAKFSLGFLSIGDTFEVYQDANYIPVTNASDRSRFVNMIFRVRDLPSGLTAIANGAFTACVKEFGKGSVYEGCYIDNNGTAKVAFCVGASALKSGYASFINCGTDITDGTLIGEDGANFLGPMTVEKCAFARIFKTGEREVNLPANIDPTYLPRKGDKVDYLFAVDPTKACGAMYNGTAWIEYALATPAA